MRIFPALTLAICCWPCVAGRLAPALGDEAPARPAVAARPAIQLEAPPQLWSLEPPRRHAPPPVNDPAWPRNAIDRFVLARLDREGLTPNSRADRRTLLRRVSFDLLGLPPSSEELAAFLADDAPGAWERLVERMLASPHYGERWARMWLDVARYAEDQAHVVGNDNSLFYPNAYLYRDWVIAALNRDMPYDRFVRLQLAADHFQPEDRAAHAALGFLGLGPKYYRRKAPEVMADEWEDRVDVVTRGLLGLTVACARCHDHKFDPISTEDYYALAGVFASTRMFNRPLDEKRKTKGDGQAKNPEDALHIVRDDAVRDLNVFIRGDVNHAGPLVPRGFLRALGRDGRLRFADGSGRRELADAIVSRDNPLTARVVVNRVWAMHFGPSSGGLVRTPSNFGRLGEPPTHPRLLDDLAVRFMEHGWSLKWLHREILLSATWRQSSRIDATGAAVDPANRLLWRMNRRRLDVESWRDAILAAAGRLQRTIGGPSIDPQNPDERRRTVYSRISRLELNPMLSLFDVPDPNAHAARRVETITPLQKMFVLNSPFMVRQGKALARLSRTAGRDDAERIRWTVRRLFGRQATCAEVKIALAFLSEAGGEPAGRWSQYAQVLLASNEMLIID